jgi:hypothetical protein
MNQALTGTGGGFMGVTRQSWWSWTLAAAVALWVAGPTSGPVSGGSPAAADEAAALAARDALVGEYRHSTVSPAGKTRRSVATIAPRGAGLSVMWEEDEGNLFGGIGISLDGIVGAAYTEALNGSYRGKGVLAYRIRAGTLDGVRLPSDIPEGTLIRETLEGPPALEGRYSIARSLDSAGRSYHSGFVDIVRDGDTYQMTWFTPARSYEGVGLRVGDVLVASYGNGFAPGIIAYCADAGLLTGIVTYGHVGTIGADTMVRANAGTEDAQASPRCRDAIDRWNPSLVRG